MMIKKLFLIFLLNLPIVSLYANDTDAFYSVSLKGTCTDLYKPNKYLDAKTFEMEGVAVLMNTPISLLSLHRPSDKFEKDLEEFMELIEKNSFAYIKNYPVVYIPNLDKNMVLSDTWVVNSIHAYGEENDDGEVVDRSGDVDGQCNLKVVSREGKLPKFKNDLPICLSSERIEMCKSIEI